MSLAHLNKASSLRSVLGFFALSLVLLILSSCQTTIPDEIEAEMANLPEKLDFNIHVKPILSDRCYACHGPDQAKREAGLRLDEAQAAYAPLPDHPDKVAITPKSLRNSEAFHRITSASPDLVMPPPKSELHLSARDKAILIRWIQEGAEYKPHWAFTPPISPEIPSVQSKDWPRNDIDQFILHKLEEQALPVSAQADAEILRRRLSLDLTGLPPDEHLRTVKEGELTDEQYEAWVDQLLASPHFGERMAADWMDVSRFADTHGYTVDRYRDMSPWRDWVIEAFNEDMPFDQFITWQLAGDLLPDATDESILATGFNRNHQQNMEGGIVPEEFRVEYVADRTNTLGTAFMGMTLECARCHDHKYDPISQENYYQLFSFFNNVQEAGQISWDNATPVPTLLLTSERTDSLLALHKQNIEQRQQELAAFDQSRLQEFEAWYQRKKKQEVGIQPPLQAHFDFDGNRIQNRLPPYQVGVMKQQHVKGKIQADLVEGRSGKGLRLDGDAWLDMGAAGVFDRATPFSIGLWAKIPTGLENGVLFHKGIGAALYNFRGYHLALKDNRFEILMARTEPYNAIIEYSDDIPRDEWIHLALTYDGSSTADGLRFFINGNEQSTEVTSNHLYKSILFDMPKAQEPGLQIGARWRGVGAAGTVVDDIKIFEGQLSGLEVKQLAAASTTDPSSDLVDLYKEYYQFNSSKNRKSLLSALESERRQYNQVMDTIKEIMVIREMEKPRSTFILDRGLYDSPKDQVFPNTPERLLPFSDELPKNRLGLAQWLLDPANPTTARVMVNRIWQQFFGRGLVATAEDFGNQGQLPSHPALLDLLAVEFRESGWDTKALVKLIVMSSTYRQSSKASTLQREKDPENIYLSRGPSMRLTAEMLRDNALAASGLLSDQIGGPSVKPYQPDGLWRINGSKYQADKGEKLYRRSLYTFWKRTIPHPTQATFDAPSRANCTVRRQKTSTPLQALVLLNDPIFLEAAKVLGQKISTESDNRRAITNAFKSLAGRSPTADELQVLLDLQQQEIEKFKSDPGKTAGWLQAGEFELETSIDPALLAANAVVASTIINADASLIKR
ncbi:MAG: DUF1553 domain-containing protein [Saprospiraceae bacterium]|nr:DUF1553 domain-containing protein [Saprospiraceae bacterium]